MILYLLWATVAANEHPCESSSGVEELRRVSAEAIARYVDGDDLGLAAAVHDVEVSFSCLQEDLQVIDAQSFHLLHAMNAERAGADPQPHIAAAKRLGAVYPKRFQLPEMWGFERQWVCPEAPEDAEECPESVVVDAVDGAQDTIDVTEEDARDERLPPAWLGTLHVDGKSNELPVKYDESTNSLIPATPYLLQYKKRNGDQEITNYYVRSVENPDYTKTRTRLAQMAGGFGIIGTGAFVLSYSSRLTLINNVAVCQAENDDCALSDNAQTKANVQGTIALAGTTLLTLSGLSLAGVGATFLF